MYQSKVQEKREELSEKDKEEEINNALNISEEVDIITKEGISNRITYYKTF